MATSNSRLALLKRNCKPAYYIANEMACRPLPQYEVWSVDVGMAVRERVRAIREGWMMGAPDLVVGILSPSNTAREMVDREHTMFAGGCRQFWIVDGTKRTVKTCTPDGRSLTYTSGDMIPMDLFGSQSIALDDIFVEP